MKIVTTLFRNIETSFLTIFLMLFSIGQLQRIQLPDDQALYLHDGLIVLFLGWKAARSYIVKNPKKIKTILKKITTAFPLETMWVAWLLGVGKPGFGSTGTTQIYSLSSRFWQKPYKKTQQK